MKMNAQAMWLFILVTLIKPFTDSHGDFKLSDSPMTALEGSCAKIVCNVTGAVEVDGAYWFWMKDALWIQDEKQFRATIVYSSNAAERPVDPGFISRVKYVGTPPSNWNLYTSSRKFCSISICDLKTTDSGRYAFRFQGKSPRFTWATSNVTLTVKQNPCLLTFEAPHVVKEFQTLTLTCSTSRSCPTNPQIGRGTHPSVELLSAHQQPDAEQRVTTHTFNATWVDDGREFSCQTKNNADEHLIRYARVTVEYPPRDTMAKTRHSNIVEGQYVTLTCSAKGRPDPSFHWIKDGKGLGSQAELTIPSIRDSQSGEYYCVASNRHGEAKSRLPLNISVEYAPQTEVKMTSPVSEVKQGDEVTLECAVKRSNPPPYAYTWFMNGRNTHVRSSRYKKRMEPGDSGSYTCQATNTQGSGTSEPLQISVQYRPRWTNISISKNDKKVKVNEFRTLTCKADANPAPVSFTWYRYTGTMKTDSLPIRSTNQDYLSLGRVQRTDEACYKCKATNIISTGEMSEPLCIQVLYPPTHPWLSMDTEVTEGQLTTINCTVESFPPSQLKLIRVSTLDPQSPEWNFRPDHYQQPNTCRFSFHVNPTHTGFYRCDATNTEGSSKSIQRKLMVKYRPTGVVVQARPALTVNENMTLMLRCIAQAYPPVTSFMWTKTTDGKKEVVQTTQTINITSASPPDIGLYSCSASNEVGTGNSQQVEVKVKYAPKQPNITRGAEQQHRDGMRSVTLSCSSHSYPSLSYSWYRRLNAKEMDIHLSNEQNYTVHSDQPGVYYCAAENEINRTQSDSVQLFVNRGFLEAPKIFFLFLIPPLVIFLLVLVYRHKRSKAIKHRTANTPPCCAFLGRWSWNCASRRTPRNQPFEAEASRSRGDRLPEQQCCPKSQRRQPHRGSAPAANINTVYCTVKLPGGKQGPAAQEPIGEQRGPAEDESPLPTGNKQRKKGKGEQNAVYAMVSKQKPLKKNGRERPGEMGQVDAAHCETDTSEEEVELNYSQVNFTAKPEYQRGVWRDSSTSGEEETQYSDVKV